MNARNLWPLLILLGFSPGACSRSEPATGVAVRVPSPLFDPALADSMLESPERDSWQKPDEIITALGIRPGMTVADVGAGSGYLLPRLSRAVGSQGCVLAQEIQEAFLVRLRDRARILKNVKVVQGTERDPNLPERRIDLFVMLTVYHEVAEPILFLRSLHRSATPGARLAVIDFDIARNGIPRAPAGHEMAESSVISEAREAGWKLVLKHEFISSQFFLVFGAK